MTAVAGKEAVSGTPITTLKDQKLKDENSINWFLYHKDNPVEQIGSIWLFQFSNVDARISSAMLGYTLSEKYRRKGYMSEALGAVIRFTFEKLGLQRIEARIRISNEKSRAVVRRAGFTKVGIVRNVKWGSGDTHGIEIVELDVWILGKEEWKAHLEGLVTTANL